MTGSARRIGRRPLLRALAALPVAAVTGGCTGPAFLAGGGRASISYGIWDADQVPAMREVIAQFRVRHPDIDVRIELTPFTTYWTRLQTSIVGGGAPDVFWMNAPNLVRYARHGTLLPLSAPLREAGVDLTAHPADLVGIYQYRDEQYAMPKDFDTVSLFYNSELLDRAGVPYPDATWTWQHLLDAAAEVRGIDRGVQGFSAVLDRQRVLYPAIFQAGGQVLRGGRSGFADDDTIAGLAHLTGAIDRGLAPNAMATFDTTDRDLFLSGRLAFYNGLPTDSTPTYADPAVRARTGITVLPRGRRPATVIHGLANAVNARTAHPQACAAFVAFMAGRECGEIQGRAGTILPSHTGTQQAFFDARPEFAMRTFADQVPDAGAYPATESTLTWEQLQLQLLGPSWVGPGGRPVAESARLLATAMDRVLENESS